MSGLLAILEQWTVETIYSSGYLGVFVLTTLIGLHLLPLPTQPILALAGFLVGQGRFSFVLVLAASTAGEVVSSLGLYYLGHRIGEKNLHRLVGRLERFKLVYRADLDKTSEAFEQHGGKAILIGHLVPTVGALISIPAGIRRMPILKRFMLYTILASTLWNGAFIILGWVLGAQWASVRQYAPIMEYAVLAAMVGGILWLLWRRWKARR
jgi:membrane protein DedA with SNARE-associated domain